MKRRAAAIKPASSPESRSFIRLKEKAHISETIHKYFNHSPAIVKIAWLKGACAPSSRIDECSNRKNIYNKSVANKANCTFAAHIFTSFLSFSLLTKHRTEGIDLGDRR